MKKKIIIIISIIVLLLIATITILLLKDEKIVYGKNAFYLEDNLYNTRDNYESIDVKKVNNLIQNKKSFTLFASTSYCSFKTPCDNIFKAVYKKNKMKLYEIRYDKLKNTEVVDSVKYAPTLIIFKEGKVVAYLDANSDKDYDKYQNKKVFRKWLSKYIYLSKEK